MAKSTVELKDRERPTADWVIEGLLKRQNTGFIMGPPKRACKSWLLLDMAWSLSAGECVWGTYLKPPRPLRTIYFTQEDTEDDAHDRVLAKLGAGKEPNDRLWIVPKNLQIKLDTEIGKRLIAEEINHVIKTAGPVDLVIFDPLRRMHNGDENDSSVIAKLWGTLDNLHRSANCATMIAHHIRKPPQDKTGYDPSDPYNGRGSGDIYGGGDAFVTVVPGRGNLEERMLQAYFESKRGKPIAPANLKVTYARGSVDFLGSGFNPVTDDGEAVREVRL